MSRTVTFHMLNLKYLSFHHSVWGNGKGPGPPAVSWVWHGSQDTRWAATESGTFFTKLYASLMAQMVKNPPAMWENWVWSLGWEDPLEKGLATHSSILAWRSQWTEEPGGLQSTGMQRVGHDWATKHSTTLLERRIDIFLSFFLFGCAS